MAEKSLERIFSKKLNEANKKIKTSFVLIRQDIEEMQSTIDAMRKYLKSKDKQYQYAKKEDNKIRDEFRREVDEFSQKITQLNLALSEVRKIQEDVVVVKDLARIEDGIKTSFKNEIEGYKEQVKELKSDLREADRRLEALENGKVRETPKARNWWTRRAAKKKGRLSNKKSED